MSTEKNNQKLYDDLAALSQKLTHDLSSQILTNPSIATTIQEKISNMQALIVARDDIVPAPPDGGLAALVGLGANAARDLGDTRMRHGVRSYDETVISERLIAVGDLYYLYQHEVIGVFKVVRKLQDLFRAGSVKLSSGEGAYSLYKFDRRDVLRYTQQDRHAAYRRVLGYGRGPVSQGARPNTEFHLLFSQFMRQVGQFWRDKRISDVIRNQPNDPSFGSIAEVRSGGLAMRQNLKQASYGNTMVMRVEVMQLLEEAFAILRSDDIMRLFGAESDWDVVEEVLLRYFNERLMISPRQRMAVSGREVLRWLAQSHVLENSRVGFETLLLQIAEFSEDWVVSAESVGIATQSSMRPPVSIGGIQPRSALATRSTNNTPPMVLPSQRRRLQTI
jgi:hypothetical protein